MKLEGNGVWERDTCFFSAFSDGFYESLGTIRKSSFNRFNWNDARSNVYRFRLKLFCLLLFLVMGSVTSALTRTRNALVKVGSEPENHDPERSQSAPESDRGRKKSARFNVSSQTGRQSSRPSLTEVLSRQDSDGPKLTSKKKTSEGQLGGELDSSVLLLKYLLL